MDTLFEFDNQDVLHGWAEAGGRRRRGAQLPVTGLRFAFYERTSTAEFQDPVTSRAWQREMAELVIAEQGVITCELFDVGCSRRVPWMRRPRAAALLEQAQECDRVFDVVVVGEFERAFAGRQFQEVASVLAALGVAVWLPETGWPVDLADPDHRVLMQVLAAQSQREVVRSRHRTLAARRRSCLRFIRGGAPAIAVHDDSARPHRLEGGCLR